MPALPPCPCSRRGCGSLSELGGPFPLLLGLGPPSGPQPALPWGGAHGCQLPVQGTLSVGPWPVLCHQLSPHSSALLSCPAWTVRSGTPSARAAVCSAAHLLLCSHRGRKALRPGKRDGALPGEQWAAVSCLQGSRQGHPVSLSTHPGGLALPLCPLRLCVCVCLSVLAPPANRPLLGSCPFPHGLWGCESTPLALRALAPVLFHQGWQRGAPISLGGAGLPGPRDRHPHGRVLSLA